MKVCKISDRYTRKEEVCLLVNSIGKEDLISVSTLVNYLTTSNDTNSQPYQSVFYVVIYWGHK